MATTPQQAKENGNAAFKAGQYPAAVGHYTRAIVLSQSNDLPVDPTFYLNRAAAYLKLEKYDDALRDCSSSLLLKPKDVKALFRRAQARIGLGDNSGARADLEEALRLEPGNEAVKALLGTLPDKVQPSKVKPVSVSPSPLAATVAERSPPSSSSASSSSKPVKRRRIPIALVDEPGEEKKKPLKSALKPSGSSLPPPRVEPFTGQRGELLTPVSSTRLTGSSGPSSSAAPVGQNGGTVQNERRTESQSQPATFAAARDARAKRVGGGVFKADGTAKLIGSDGKELLELGPNGDKEVVERRPPSSSTPASQPRPGGAEAGGGKSVRLPPAPKRASEFTLALRDLPEEARWSYLQLTPPEKLPALFGSALEPDTLSSLIRILSSASSQAEEEEREKVRKYLEAIPRCSRFGTMRLFLPRGDEELVRQVLDGLGVEKGETVRREWGV